MRLISLLTTLSLLACADEDKTEVNDTSEPVEDTDTDTDSDTETDTDTGGDTDTEEPDPLDVDDDGDGQTENQGDCDDTNADIYTEAEETCDGVDNNCSGDENDAIDPSDWYEDADGDTFGNAAVSTQSCEPPEGYVDNDLDCNDQDASSVAPQTWYPDTDQDGLGDPTVSTEDCQQPSGTVNNGDDCDDTNAEIGMALTWYSDADEDGLGDPNTLSTTCTPPSDSVDNGDDCDDTDPQILGPDIWYLDLDSDGYGDPNTAVALCIATSAHVSNGLDCDDSDPTTVDDFDCDGILGIHDCDDNDDTNLQDNRFDTDCDGTNEINGYVEGTHTEAFYARSAFAPYSDEGMCESVFQGYGELNAQGCVNCDFEFDVSYVYDPALSDPGSTLYTCPIALFTYELGYNANYLGYGPTLFLGGNLMFSDGDVGYSPGSCVVTHNGNPIGESWCEDETAAVNFTGTQFSYDQPDDGFFFYGSYYIWYGAFGTLDVYAPDSDGDGANDLVDSHITDPNIQ